MSVSDAVIRSLALMQRQEDVFDTATQARPRV
jgi:hypothetical protein